MLATRIPAATAVALTLLLSACATGQLESATPPPAPVDTAPAATNPAATKPAAVPELTLNLPKGNNCACTEQPAVDVTFLEQGYSALLDGEYEQAMENFQRYQRLESSPTVDLESGIAIAYLQMLPRSPFYNPELARSSFKVLREKNAKKLQVHDYVRLMRQSLLNLLKLQERVDKLKASNATLQQDLEKREEALKRLRDLALGQKGASP